MLLHLGNSFWHFLFKYCVFCHPLFTHLINLRALYPSSVLWRWHLKMYANWIFHLSKSIKLHQAKLLLSKVYKRFPLFVGFIVLSYLQFYWIISFRKYNKYLSSGYTAVYKQKQIILFQGILPEILEELLSARKRAKADLKVTELFWRKSFSMLCSP